MLRKGIEQQCLFSTLRFNQAPVKSDLLWEVDLPVEVSGVDRHAETDHHRGQKLGKVDEGEEGRAEGCRRATVQGMT